MNSEYQIPIQTPPSELYHFIDLFISHFVPEHLGENGVLCMSLKCHIAQILNVDISVLLFYIIINKMKYQITENEENLSFGKKNAQVSVVTLKVL